VMPFSALGLDTYPVTDAPGEITGTARKIIESKYALVVVAENTAGIAEEILSSRLNEPTPCIVVVPFTTESTGLATKSLSSVLKAATGVDIMRQ